MKRRTFLQKAGLALLALGVSETALSLLGDKSFANPLLERYYQALTQPSTRKLALLVGINQYLNGTPLGGCITDVELQKELLIHRFGFNPHDILTLTDAQATRGNIETAFLEHLTKQAAAGDVVVLHFSGYGSRVVTNEENSSIQNPHSQSGAWERAKIQNSLVPVDGMSPGRGGAPGSASAANNLLEETLLLLLLSLATDRVTTVLDTSYTNAGTVLQGNLRIRSCPSLPQEQPGAEELAFLEQLLLKINVSREQLEKQRSSGQPPGIVLAAARPSQPATEVLWGGFSAGMFTYALTQHLWQAAPPTTVQVSVSRAAGVVEQLVGDRQQPTVSGQKSSDEQRTAYHLMPEEGTCADGVVMGVEDNGKTAQLWLAGLPAKVLEYYGVNSQLALSNPVGAIAPPPMPDRKVQLQIRSKDGLTAKARIVGTTPENYSLQVGQLVQESIRVLPRNVGLTVALDAGLERIERVDATSAFASVASVSSVVTAGEQPADYLFGKPRATQPSEKQQTFLQESGSKVENSTLYVSLLQGGYGLFSLGLDPISNTTGQVGEAVKVAVNRLTPKLKMLLAAKLWRLTANEGSSRLGVSATLEMVAPNKEVLVQRETLRRTESQVKSLGGAGEGESPHTVLGEIKENLTENLALGAGTYTAPLERSLAGIPILSIGSRIQYQIQNQSNQPIYFVVLGIDSSGNTIALYPPQSSGIVAALETLTVPQPFTSFEWVVTGPAGLAETQLICSRAPLTQTLVALAAARRRERDRFEVGELFNPLDVARALLQDLHDASAIAPETIGASSDIYALDVNAWSTFSFIYQVV